MAIGERIHYFRTLLGLTQRQLGERLGFRSSQADVRIAQYESGARSPKQNYMDALANIFGVSSHALSVPDIDSYIGLMHTFFTLEDRYGLKIKNTDDGICLKLDTHNREHYTTICKMFCAWQEQAERYEKGEITKEEYDLWRYNYPKFDKTQIWASVPSQELSDLMLQASNKRQK